jgi:type III restriction enzyme
MTPTMPESELFDLDRIEAVAARLDLRRPNRQALESIVFETVQHYDIDGEPPPFEAVVASATGVGKTYILAAAIEYFAGDDVRNFAVITPGRTILDKTVANFTPGHPKSLLGGMDTEPVVITSDNFATATMRAAMDDPAQVKLFVFTVQALIKPESKAGRRTHKFQEGLGEAFYAHLQGLADLVVFADEHHTYYGPSFSAAIRDLHPRLLIGLTATPNKKTPLEQIIYRYPLAAAIAERLVKTPVLVGRRDDRSDPTTKLLDGVRLLELKEQAVARWCADTGATPVNPVMLVIAPTIPEAQEVEGIVTDPGFAGGRYKDRVLTVHSSAPDEALKQLAELEELSSPYRIVISVGMLKEGWDVKNVYVIASLRASVSDILTEQTLGRGLRLPFGEYTGIELLDTLEVLGHERYQELLRKAGVLNEQFIDRRTRAVLRRNAEGKVVAVSETTDVSAPVLSVSDESIHAVTPPNTPPGGGLRITSVEDHTAQAEADLRHLVELAPRPDIPPLHIPQLTMTTVKNDFSLADIVDPNSFRQLGERLAADPVGTLHRYTLSARIIKGADGLRRTEVVALKAADRVESPASIFPLLDLRHQLISQLLSAPAVPARANQQRPAAAVVDAFLQGLGPSAEGILSGYLDRAAAALVQLVTEKQREYVAKPTFGEVIEVLPFGPIRIGRPDTSDDRYGTFRRGCGYEGYRKSLYAQDWFDSSPERTMANVLDDEDGVRFWVRLQTHDLPILWSGAKEYNPDFVAVDGDDVHWIIEVKMDKEMTSEVVQGKREAARRWANHVSADETVGTTWRYLLLSEADIKTAKGSWEALKALGA